MQEDTHVSAVLYALANLNPPSFRLKLNVHVTIGEEEYALANLNPPSFWLKLNVHMTIGEEEEEMPSVPCQLGYLVRKGKTVV